MIDSMFGTGDDLARVALNFTVTARADGTAENATLDIDTGPKVGNADKIMA